MHKSTTQKLVGLSMGARVQYRTGVRNPDGSTRWLRKWHKNLILDSGLNSVGARTWAESFTYGAIGTGTNPVERDSGATTFTAAAGTVTASAGFFEAGDVGRLLRLDTGEQGYITAFGSTTSVTWNGVDVGVGQPGTVYYVNRTALQTEVKRTNTYRTSSGDNGTTWNAVNAEYTFARTYLFTAEVGAVTYREVGWSWGSGATSLFGMDILAGGGDSLVAGQQYLIQVNVIVRYSPATSTSAPDVGSGGWNTEGDIILADIRNGGDGGGPYPVSSVSSSGGSSGGGSLEPGSSSQVPVYRVAVTFSLPAGPTEAQVTSPAASSTVDLTRATYTTGNFYRDLSATFSVSAGNGDWFGLVIGRTTSGGAPYSVAAALKFDATQTKDNVHTVTVTFRFTWNRRF